MQELWTSGDLLRDLLLKYQQPDVQQAVREINDAYLHWDDVRFRLHPLGISLKELWHAVKFNRIAGQQKLPITFYNTRKKLYYITPPKHVEWLHHIDKQGGGAIGVSDNSALGDESERYLYSSLMEEAIASSQLEGASTTRRVAKEMLRSKRKPQTTAEKMILNNYQAILEVRERKQEKLTPELLCHLQSVLMDGILEKSDGVGRFRREDEAIHVVDTATNTILHTPPPASELSWRIQEICDFANTESDPFIHPVVKAAVLHFAIGFIHPFVDGNGRTARALFYWYMLKQDYWLFEYFPISRVLLRAPVKYARAYLFTETDSGDATYFIQYNLQALQRAIRDFYNYVAHEERQAREAAVLLESFPGLNQRQRFLIHDALKNPGLSCNFSSHQGKYHVTNPTARADILGLVRLGFLRENKTGKVHTFRPAPNLRELLHLPVVKTKPNKEKLPKPIAITVKKAAAVPPTDEPKNTTSDQPSLFD